jgi:prepilin-type processing-associated H-X9-DG protein
MKLHLSINVESDAHHQAARNAGTQQANCFIWWPESSLDKMKHINSQLAPGQAPPADYFFIRPSSFHPGGVNVTFCDGHARFISQDIQYGVYCLLCTPDGANCNTPGHTAGLDPPGGTNVTYYPSGDNYLYLRNTPLDSASNGFDKSTIQSMSGSAASPTLRHNLRPNWPPQPVTAIFMEFHSSRTARTTK